MQLQFTFNLITQKLLLFIFWLYQKWTEQLNLTEVRNRTEIFAVPSHSYQSKNYSFNMWACVDLACWQENTL